MRDLWRAQGARLCLGAILLLALALRLYRLDAQSLWNDEGTSVALAGRDLATITRSAAADIHPPLYYYLLHAWTGLWGTGEAAARSLSALAGVGLVAATYALGRRTLGAGAGLAAALLAAVSPFGVYYAQEARMYVLATLLGALSMLAYVRLLAGWAAPAPGRRAQRLAAGGYLLATVAAVYTHYFAFSLLAAQNVALALWLAWRYRAGARRDLWRVAAPWAGLQVAVVALYVPWLIASRSSLTAWPAVSEPLTLPFLAREALRVLALGVTCCLFTSLVMLPAILVWIRPARSPSADESSGEPGLAATGGDFQDGTPAVVESLPGGARFEHPEGRSFPTRRAA